MKRYLTAIKLVVAIVAVNVLSLLPLALKAQDIPTCGGTSDPDPYDYCPIDTWVWVFAAVVVIFTVVKMNTLNKARSYNAD